MTPFVIGIKRRFWFGYTKYRCAKFLFRKSVKVEETDGTIALSEIDMWMVLLCLDGRDVIIPQIEKRQWCVFSGPVLPSLNVTEGKNNGLQIQQDTTAI